MATAAPVRFEDQLRTVTDRVRAELRTHEGRPSLRFDQNFFQETNRLLSQARALVTNFSVQRPDLLPADRYENKYPIYVERLRRHANSLVNLSDWPLHKLERALSSQRYKRRRRLWDDHNLSDALQKGARTYMTEYPQRASFDRWTEDYHGANYSDCWLACQQVMSVLHDFCDVVHEVLHRAMRIYGREKASTRRFVEP